MTDVMPVIRGRRAGIWRNWSGTARCAPAVTVEPASEDDIVAAIRAADERDLTVRVCGAGRSFNALACTDGVLIDLSRFTGVLDVDQDDMTVTVRAGTSVRSISAVLDRFGLALANVGTLADQTVGGAISTGNHGSGLGHGPLASQVAALRLISANGDVLACGPSSNLAVLRCARTALGALGVISVVTLRCVPRFNLRVRYGSEPLDALLECVGEWAASADHVAFSWLPWQDRVGTRAMRVTNEQPGRGTVRRRYSTTLSELRCGAIGLAARLGPDAVPGLTDRFAAVGQPRGYVDASHRVFSFRQPVRFIAAEHALPLENVAPAFRELRDMMRRFAQQSPYSLLARVGAPDDTPLSMSHGRPTGYINITAPRSVRYLGSFRAVECMLREFDARPHWGKEHTATADILASRYPEWDEFQRVRTSLDPDGKFTNDYLGWLLGPVRCPGNGGG